MTSTRRAWPFSSLALRILVALALVGALLWHAGPGTILETLAHADSTLLGLAFGAVLAYSGVKAWLWYRLLVALGVCKRGQFSGVMACYLTGAFLGSVLPSTAGTDAARAVLAQRRFGGDLSPYVASVVVLNALSWLAACTMGLAAIAVLSRDGLSPLELVAAPLLASILGAIVVVHLLLKHRRVAWLRLLRRTPVRLRRIRRPLRRFSGRLLVFERTHAHFTPIFLTAVAAQVGFALTLLLTGASVGIDLELKFWLIYGPLVSTVALIPASVSGFGADQVGFVYFMSLVGVGESSGFVTSALNSMLNLVFNLGIGGLAFVLQPALTRRALK